MDGDEDLVTYLQRAVGYSLTGDTREQVLFFLHGSGANGKSTFLETVLTMLGDYGCQAVPELLMVRKSEPHPCERADLFGRRLVSCVEVEEGKRLAETLLKQFTGSDRIRARWQHENFFEFRPVHTLWLAANHKPVVRGTDHAIWRRIKLVPFNVTFDDERKDPTLPQKLREELPGILNWAVKGCLDWQRGGLAEPDAVRMATAEYRSEMDTVGQFLQERCVIGRDLRIAAKQLYAAFVTWCAESQERPMNQHVFGRRMRDKGFESGRSGTGATVYHGLATA
jgi:putative DNA primase/helicase